MTNAASNVSNISDATKIRRIHWNKEEEQMIRDELYVQIVAHTKGDRINIDFKEVDYLEMMRKAQLVLPADRQRDPGVPMSVFVRSWKDQYISEMEAMHKSFLLQGAGVDTSSSVPVAEQVVEKEALNKASLLTTELQSSIDAFTSSMLAVVRHNVDQQVDAMLDEIVASIGDKLVYRLNERTSTVVKQFHSQAADTLDKALNHKEKVFIIGPIPAQQEAILRDCGEAFDFVFDEGFSTKQILAKAKGAYAVLFMTEKGNHTTESLVKSHPGFHRVNGGMTSIKDKVAELYVAWSDSVKGRVLRATAATSGATKVHTN